MSDLRQILTNAGQARLLRHWEQLPPAGQAKLAAQIQNVNFAELDRLLKQPTDATTKTDVENRALPPQAIRLHSASNRFSAEQARNAGIAALRQGRIGVILVAGGQGTRLGFDHPKGMFPIGPISGATLFQILIEGILATARRYGVSIPLYLMTSPATHTETVAHLAEHNRYGLAAPDLTVFCQGTMPAVEMSTGDLLLASPDELALSPDGHGGSLAALAKLGCFADFERRGITQLYYLQIDNPVAPVCDPAFIGYHLLAESEMSTLVVAKQLPSEKVGHLVEIDDRAHILEYSDVSAAFTEQRHTDGSLRFWAGNTAMHVMDTAFLKRRSGADGLPFHIAKKKVPYLNDTGELVEPTIPNAVKFERFIFDLLPASRNPLAVEVLAENDFMPVKNAPGDPRDTPETAKRAILAKHRRWLEQAGAVVATDASVEISPLFALDADECAKKISAGTRIEKPTYFR